MAQQRPASSPGRGNVSRGSSTRIRRSARIWFLHGLGCEGLRSCRVQACWVHGSRSYLGAQGAARCCPHGRPAASGRVRERYGGTEDASQDARPAPPGRTGGGTDAADAGDGPMNLQAKPSAAEPSSAGTAPKSSAVKGSGAKNSAAKKGKPAPNSKHSTPQKRTAAQNAKIRNAPNQSTANQNAANRNSANRSSASTNHPITTTRPATATQGSKSRSPQLSAATVTQGG